VSPKSGRAVSQAAGAPWHDRLLRLPSFLRAEPMQTRPSPDELTEAFALTGYFLLRHVFEQRETRISDAREQFVGAVTRAVPAAAAGGGE
jgi:DNA repair protein RecO (recombination protein O)